METIRIEKRNGVAWLTWNRPQKLNALNETMLRETALALKEFEADEDVFVVVLTGEGRSFSSGQDLTIEEDVDYGSYLKTVYHPLVRRLSNFTKPVIAGIHGVVAGAGLSLALAADVRIVARSTKFSPGFIKIGLVADAGGPYHLRRLMRLDQALNWMWSGRTIDADTAEAYGLVTMLVNDEVYLLSVEEYAETLAAKSQTAVQGMKALLQETSLDTSLEKEVGLQRECGETLYHQRAIRAFLNKER